MKLLHILLGLAIAQGAVLAAEEPATDTTTEAKPAAEKKMPRKAAKAKLAKDEAKLTKDEATVEADKAKVAADEKAVTAAS